MPQPYDYSTQPVNVDNYFNSLRQGREDRAQQETATRQTALQKYMPGALNGDAEAQQQAFANATPDQAVQLKQALMKMEDSALAKTLQQQEKFASLAQWADTPEKWAQATQMAESEGLKGAAAIPFEQRGAKLAGMMSVKDQLEEEWKRRDFELKTRETNASIGAKNAAADASRRAGQGGPGMPLGGGRPLPAGVQTKEDADIEALQGARTIQQKTQGWIDQFTNGGLETGLVSQGARQFGRYTGWNTDNSRKLNLFNSDLEGMRNDSLRLNSGVQTEGDAQREWRALLDNVNDQEYVVQALKRINQLNKRAEALKMQSINIRRSRNGARPLDPAQLDAGAAGQFDYATGNAPAPSAGGGQDDFSDVDALLGLK